jgi:hypothetical protein
MRSSLKRLKNQDLHFAESESWPIRIRIQTKVFYDENWEKINNWKRIFIKKLLLDHDVKAQGSLQRSFQKINALFFPSFLKANLILLDED